MPIFVETYRATVDPADCDHLDHMNVQHYFAAVSDGMFAIMVRLGLGPEEIRRRQISFAVVRAETDFHRELRPGDVMSLESTVLTRARSPRRFITS
jgi:acyl-CoA thioester hydrolase